MNYTNQQTSFLILFLTFICLTTGVVQRVQKQHDSLYVFVDKSGKIIEKLRRWKHALDFDETGYAKVTDYKDRVYRLNTKGKTFGMLYDLNKPRPNACIFACNIDFPQNKLSRILDNTQLKFLSLYTRNEGFDHKNSIDSLLMGIARLKNLESLKIKQVSTLKHLGSEIGQLKKLKELWVRLTALSSLPKEIAGLSQLKKLVLIGNALDTLPQEFTRLANLEVAYVNYSGLKSLPKKGWDKLTKLRKLILWANKLTILPEDVCNLPRLQSLSLGGNKLALLPANIDKLTQLQYLGLRSNNFSSIPAGIFNMTWLQHLDLNHNNLTTIPAEIGKLTQLESLDLGYNELTSFPESMHHLKKLKNLYIYKNQFSDAEKAKIQALLPHCKIHVKPSLYD